jgi:predicted nucleic acid-binding protein
MSLFVDASAWYAAADHRDRSNERAKKALAGSDDLVTSDHVLIECWFLLRHRLGRASAERFWDGIRSGVAALEFVTPADLEAAWAIGMSFADQDFSVVDRTSFALMQRLGIERVATFDADFAIFRFGRQRERAFVIVS